MSQDVTTIYPVVGLLTMAIEALVVNIILVR
jgi:hypothetical protein